MNTQDDIVVIDDEKETSGDDLVIGETEANDKVQYLEDGKVLVKLYAPITYKIKPAQGMGEVREKSISELTFRRPNGGDMTAAYKFPSAWDQIKVLISRMAAIDLLLIEKMDLDDLMTCGEVINHFLPSAQKTGKQPSQTSP